MQSFQTNIHMYIRTNLRRTDKVNRRGRSNVEIMGKYKTDGKCQRNLGPDPVCPERDGAGSGQYQIGSEILIVMDGHQSIL